MTTTTLTRLDNGGALWLADRSAPPQLRDSASNPETAAKLLRPLIGRHKTEAFAALDLDSRNNPIRIRLVSLGTLNASLVHPREVFGPAVAAGDVAALIVAHNHPSGDNTPSEDDLAITRRLIEVGYLLGIECLDHLIVTRHTTFWSYQNQMSPCLPLTRSRR